MKKKLFALALLTASASAFAAPISTPVNVSDTPIIGGNNNSCGRVDLTNATSDYMLKPCEEAIYSFYNSNDSTIYVPLHIAIDPNTPNAVYEIKIFDTEPTPTWDRGHTSLCPNNMAYTDQFRSLGIWSDEKRASTTGSTLTVFSPISKPPTTGLYTGGLNVTNTIYLAETAQFLYTQSCFYIDKFPNGMASATVSVGNRVMIWDSGFDSSGDMQTVRFMGTTGWLDKTTPWTSLGTIATTLKSGYILVRRVI